MDKEKDLEGERHRRSATYLAGSNVTAVHDVLAHGLKERLRGVKPILGPSHHKCQRTCLGTTHTCRTCMKKMWCVS